MLALIAGQGAVPDHVAQALDAAGTPFLLCAVHGTDCGVPGRKPDLELRLERIGSFLETLADRGVRTVCLAGAVQRPELDPGAIDPQTLPLVPRIISALQAGDDSALRTVLSFFEDGGMSVCGAHEIVPELLPPAGVLSVRQPDDQDMADAARGQHIVDALGAVDVGQACVVSKGQALAVEAMPGTDRMLISLLGPQPKLTTRMTGAGVDDPIGMAAARDPDLPGGGLLYKAPKPGQDRRIDLPTIGPSTIRAAHRAGLGGIVIEAGGVMVPDRVQALKLCNEFGLFLWVRER